MEKHMGKNETQWTTTRAPRGVFPSLLRKSLPYLCLLMWSPLNPRPPPPPDHDPRDNCLMRLQASTLTAAELTNSPNQDCGV